MRLTYKWFQWLVHVFINSVRSFFFYIRQVTSLHLLCDLFFSIMMTLRCFLSEAGYTCLSHLFYFYCVRVNGLTNYYLWTSCMCVEAHRKEKWLEKFGMWLFFFFFALEIIHKKTWWNSSIIQSSINMGVVLSYISDLYADLCF